MNSSTLLVSIPYQNFLFFAFFAGCILAILLLLRMIKMIIDRQIEDEMEKMIPLKIIRKKIKVEVRWL